MKILLALLLAVSASADQTVTVTNLNSTHPLHGVVPMLPRPTVLVWVDSDEKPNRFLVTLDYYDQATGAKRQRVEEFSAESNVVSSTPAKVSYLFAIELDAASVEVTVEAKKLNSREAR